jgi:hypothetical protein
LTSFAQGIFMKNNSPNFVESVLNVKASGSLSEDILKDLQLPEGKSIASLINETEENQQKEPITE